MCSLLLYNVFIWCSNENETNTKENSVNATAKRPGSRCPAGSTEVWEYGFDGFNFHRPSKNCEEGFWFCFVGGEWNFVGCKDSSGNIWTTPYDKMVIASVPEDVENTIDFIFLIMLLKEQIFLTVSKCFQLMMLWFLEPINWL